MAERSGRREGDWRVKLVLHYDGRNFYGWQIQRNRRTVQGELSNLLGRLCGGATRVTAAGRTDRGVHATGQVASAVIPARFGPGELCRALDALAPEDLWVASAERVAYDFHPRYDAISRTYIYRIGVTSEARSPFRAPWCWPLARGVGLARMRAATEALRGHRDFSAFSKSGQPERGVECRVLEAGWRRVEGSVLEFEITADRFLHHMVRYIVGTLAEIGAGARPVSDIEALLEGSEDTRSAPPAPPQGLWLTNVAYNRGEELE